MNGHLQLIPGASKEEMEALYMSERLKRKVHKKGPAPKLLGNERCEICGQLANGFHYNVLRRGLCNVKSEGVILYSEPNELLELIRLI